VCPICSETFGGVRMAKGMVVEVVCKSGDHAFGVDMSTG